MRRLWAVAGTASQVARVLAHAGALLAADAAVRAWRRATGQRDRGGILRAPEPSRDFTLAGIPAADREAFRRALLALAGDLGRAAAQADTQAAEGE